MTLTKSFLARLKETFVLATILAALALSMMPAQAQFFGGLYGIQTLTCIPSTLTNTSTYLFYTPAVTNTPQASIIYIPNGKNVTLQLTAGASATQAGTLSVAFARSIDGLTTEGTPITTLSVTYATTALVTSITNLDLGGCGYLIPTLITNTATGNFASNIVCRYALKPGF